MIGMINRGENKYENVLPPLPPSKKLILAIRGHTAELFQSQLRKTNFADKYLLVYN